ncbi:HNH endonuclease [Hymenobacter weizhouensis]|uniref:HNH endonuclease n=1 Tax=Hymenobacter sp. YIM 151500-1 TaxID=2987689 RepID=UPI002226A295|nr:HNH endonuclease [Hymenobacter sp. YIM 151500-1]UYZ63944.1 HNH endonuclease [Hymenobacter sp. YIM 151500-1]
MGRDASSGAEWVPPLAREYAYSGRPVSAAAPAAPPVNPDIPPHLPAPIPNPSPDHQQVHLSAQEWQELIKGRWDRKNNKKFLQDHRQAEFHVAGNPFTYRTDANGKVVAVYDAQKSYNVTGTRKDAKGVPLTLNAEPTFAGTSYMYPATGNQKNIVVIKMAGSRKGDFRRANKAAGLTEVVKAQGLKADQPPKGYTWHHRDDFEANPNPPPYGTCTMELVKKEAHEDTFVHYGSCDQCNEYFGIKLYD